MRLVIDANIVISSLIGNGTIFLLIKELSKAGVRLVSPSFLKEEIEEHFDEIMVKSGLYATTLRKFYKA
ncbi:MAG: PIN domain-containing protein [Nitrososphaeria archaeon]